MDIIIVILLAVGVYGLLVLTGFEKRVLTRKTGRTAESIYDNYADPARKQRRRAGQHHDEPRPERAPPPGGPAGLTHS